MTLAWIIRSLMVGVAAVAAYLLGQTDITLEPIVRVGLGALLVFLAAINPQSLADRAQSNG